MKFNLLINIISFVVILCIAIFIFIKSNKKNSEKIEFFFTEIFFYFLCSNSYSPLPLLTSFLIYYIIKLDSINPRTFKK